MGGLLASVTTPTAPRPSGDRSGYSAEALGPGKSGERERARPQPPTPRHPPPSLTVSVLMLCWRWHMPPTLRLTPWQLSSSQDSLCRLQARTPASLRGLRSMRWSNVYAAECRSYSAGSQRDPLGRPFSPRRGLEHKLSDDDETDRSHPFALDMFFGRASHTCIIHRISLTRIVRAYKLYSVLAYYSPE